MLAAGVAGTVIGGAWVAVVVALAPGLGDVAALTGRSSEILAADGSRLGYVVSDEIRTPVLSREQPRELRDATIAIEDRRFYSHAGIDAEGVARAGVANLTSGRTVQGGSTITQQLARALYIKDPKRNIERKIREAKLAYELEQEHSKRWILTKYLNAVPYGTVNGRTALGAEAAASTYFAKQARDLTLAESALLAGLPQAPSRYNPFQNPSAAVARRNDVLSRMVRTGAVTRERAQRAMRSDLGLKPGERYTKRREPYFFDYVQQQLIEKYGAAAYRRGGLTVHTTIDPKLQTAAREGIENQLGYPDDPSSAVVTIDPETGYIRTMASSGAYDERTFNLAAQGQRQPGSAFKTMVLTAAIRQGVDPRSTFYTSKKLKIDRPGGQEPWEVSTYDNSYGGRMDLVRATLKSDNTVYAQLDLDVGPKNVAKTAKLMGITSELDGLPAEGIGGLRLGVSPLEMARAYATLAAGGMRSVPKAVTRVEFPNGEEDDIGEPERKRVFSDGVASEVTKILKKNVESGTGTAASVGCAAAGKTGTTDNFNDAWFVGYTPKLASAVWVGYPDAQRSMRGVHGIDVAGGTIPAMIWHDFMAKATADGQCASFPEPSDPASFTPFNGQYATQGPPVSDDFSADGTGGQGTFNSQQQGAGTAPGTAPGGGGGVAPGSGGGGGTGGGGTGGAGGGGVSAPGAGGN